MTFATQVAATFAPIQAVYDDVAQALSWAQSFVENYCNRTFDLVTDDVAVVDPHPHRRALLPMIPVADVSSVEALICGAWTALTNYAYVGETGLLYDTTGEPGTTSDAWPWLPGSLRVTYTHGYTDVPQDLINTACRFAQQYLENPTLLLQREVGSFSERYAGNTGGVGIVINEFDKRIMDRYTLMTT
ncbi:hypothetical protein [Mycobacterium avium]|uniref:hypothetical protein n=1 Tax=Mycobacterium avium TaxID=1764 RepID=UPI0003D2096C|nr:hypothetical protein [Mycobacterium avium]ETB29466.1 hypothetical protein O971_12425 [Mycobacterium avium subsp. hominissuis 10-4249]KDO96127.1 hypothetical protein MAVA5_11600 [Mycobacterium avium subsp. hominissuis A5]